jgi:hypothetical protein
MGTALASFIDLDLRFRREVFVANFGGGGAAGVNRGAVFRPEPVRERVAPGVILPSEDRLGGSDSSSTTTGTALLSLLFRVNMARSPPLD